MRTIRNILTVAFATMTVAVSMAQFGDPVYVNGYYRWDGTYVRPIGINFRAAQTEGTLNAL